MKSILFFSLTFAALQLNAQVTDGLIQYFDFNNSYNNSTQTIAFSNNAGTSFVEGYNGQANGALNINNTGSNAIIPDLPYGTEARSVSLWVKLNQHASSGYGMLFTYGTATQSNAFSGCAGELYVQLFGYDDNLSYLSPTNLNVWTHFVFNFDGSVAKIYKNGVLLYTQVMSEWNTINDNDFFKLGTGPGGEVDWFNGAIDELKIYDRAITAEEVVLLYEYQGSSASIDKIETSDFNIFPNPATVSVSLNNLEIGQTITLFDVSGKIVFSTHATSSAPTLDISTLGSGMYFVQVQQNGVIIGTQKLQVQ